MIRGLKAAEGRPRLQWLACRVQPLHLPHPKWERKRSDFEIKKKHKLPIHIHKTFFPAFLNNATFATAPGSYILSYPDHS
jgi:hypothetical protein